ncbi:PAS domain S-box protein [Adhaeretor mobilis]|uniref:histidine kinase n=1 Tax=Adhaeretor mobilis TaxID=1930276 RepID=A0A517MX98_9BACT|nr:PAS domain S-box protein [Adhaeretor mobilis]QDS99493.1 Signal transduction histidine-protein kinase BarA [Adhaeretor mobilis]
MLAVAAFIGDNSRSKLRRDRRDDASLSYALESEMPDNEGRIDNGKLATPRAIVAIGSATGGLESLELFLEKLPVDLGVALVIVQHLNTDGSDVICEVVSRISPLPVVALGESPTVVEANHAYVSPQRCEVELRQGRLIATEIEDDSRRAEVIDTLFRSLAGGSDLPLVGVVLSGDGTDGSQGLDTIQKVGGLTISQDAESAAQQEMPQNASQFSDHILSPQKIPTRLKEFLGNCSGATKPSSAQDLPSIASRDYASSDKVSSDSQGPSQESRPSSGLSKTQLREANVALQSSKDEIEAGMEALSRAYRDVDQLLDGMQIASIFLDNRGNINRFTPSAAQIYDLQDDDVGRPLSVIAHRVVEMPPLPNSSEIATSEIPIEHELLTNDNHWFVRRTILYRQDDQFEGLILTFVDVTEQKRDALRLAVAHDVIQILAAADSFDRVSPQILEAVRSNLNADLCSLWLLDSRDNKLYCDETVISPTKSHLQQFVEAGSQLRLGRGEGLAGTVWQSEEPQWIENVTDDTQFVRRQLAIDSGLIGGAAMPINTGMRFYGAIEIYADHILRHEQSLLDMLQGVGHEIGQFIRRKRLDEKLLDEQTRKTAVLESALDCIVTMDIRGNIIDFNPAAERAFAIPSKTAIGQPLADLIIPEKFRDAHRKGLKRFLETGESEFLGKRIELTAQRADGTEFPIELAINASQRRNGTPFFTAYLRDITERRQWEQEISNRERRLNLAFDAGHIGSWEWDVVEDRITWSHQLYKLFGYTNEQFNHTREGFLDIIHPDDRERVRERLEALFTEACHEYEMEFRIMRGDNQDIIWTYGRGAILRDEQHRPLSITAVASDITSRKKLELQLTDREAHLRRVIDNMIGFVGVLDETGRLLEANETALQSGGVSRDEVIGKKFWDCYWWNYDPVVAALLKEAIQHAAAGEIIRYDATVRMANDSRLIIDFMLVPVTNEDGKVTHLIPSGVDIQDRKEAESNLADAKERLDLAMQVSQVAAWSWHMETNEVVADDNLKRLFGFNIDDNPKLSTFLSRIDEGDRARVAESIERSVQDGEYFKEEYQINKPSGERRWMRARGSARQGRDGSVDDFYGVIADITDQKHFELELADREAHLRRVINHQLGLVGVIGKDGLLLEVDDRSLAIARLDREDAVGKHFADLPWWNYDDAVSQRIRDAMDRALAGEIVRFDVPLFSAGAAGLMIDFMIAPVYGSDGQVEYLIPSGVDISERKSLEQRLSMALQSGGMAAWEWTPEQSVWSEALYDLLGLPSSTTADPETFFEQVHEQDIEGLQLAWDKATRGEQPYAHEFRIRRPDGEIRWVAGAGEFERDATGEVNRIYGLNWDITVRKLEEQRLKRIAEHEHFLVEANKMLAASLDYQQTLANLTNLCVPVLADWAFIDLLGEDGNTHRVHVAHAEPTDSDLAAEVAKFPAKPSTPDQPSARGLFEVKAMLIPDFTDEILVKAAQNKEHETVIRAVGPRSLIVVPLIARKSSLGALTLITSQSGRNYDKYDLKVAKELARHAAMAVENARLYQAGQQANIAKSDFLANMSHEIRTPMTAVLGYTDLLIGQESNPEKSEHLLTIKRNGQYLLDIINDILDLSKIEAGKLEITPERFPLHRLVADVQSSMYVRAREKQLDFRVQYDGRIPKVIESDPKRLRQILVNLVGNALKFTEEGSVRLIVRFLDSESTPRVQIDVVDTGIGITKEQRTRLFQDFSQADSSVSRKFGGTGLGLAISQRLARLLDGEITVDSVPGQGSTFSCVISAGDVSDVQLIKPALDTQEQPSVSRPTEHRLNCRVLVVDDRRDVRFLTMRILSSAGVEVSLAEDGIEALQMVKELAARGETWDLILLDMQMPRLDGYQTAARLREMQFTQPIIALTADAMHGDMNHCLRSGCNAYLSKPIDAQKLIEMVAEYTGQTEHGSNNSRVQHNSVSVLIVEDSIDACTALQRLLEIEGFKAHTAFDGKSAIEAAQTIEPAVVLLDIGLPDMSGYDVLKQMKALPALCGTKFIALTGDSHAEDSAKWQEAGFHHHLAKPTDLLLLVSLLNSEV